MVVVVVMVVCVTVCDPEAAPLSLIRAGCIVEG